MWPITKLQFVIFVLNISKIYTLSLTNYLTKHLSLIKTVLILSLKIHKLDKEICKLTERLPSNDIYIINAFNTKCNKW